jgi:hypothetical protein
LLPEIARADMGPCSSKRPPNVVFGSGGPQTGGLTLSLALPKYRYARNAKVRAVLRLQSAEPVTFSSALPYGDYHFKIYGVDTHAVPSNRSGHVEAISQIAYQRVSAQCPAYEEFDLDWLYDLSPGVYAVSASRIPQRMLSSQPPSFETMPTLVSNEVRFRIDP